MAYAYDASLLERIKPRIQQWEATTGRKMAPQMLESLYKQQLETEAARGTQERALDMQQQQLADQKQAQKDAASAAKMQGIVGLGTSAATLGLGYKALTKPSFMEELTKYDALKNAAPGGLSAAGADITAAGGAFNAPNAASAGYTLSAPAYTAPTLTGVPALPGAQTVMAGGAPALTGAQTAWAPAGASGTTSLTAGASGAEYGSGVVAEGSGVVAEGAGTAAGGSTLATVGTAAGYVGAGMLADTLIQKYSPFGGQKEKSIAGNVAKGAGAGAAVGSVVPGIGTAVGAVVGGIIGGAVGLVEDASVVCSELLRQRRITENDRKKCVLFRFRHIDQRMFDAYTEWATPIVKHMRRRRIVNFVLLPFTTRFVDYMIAIQDKNPPTLGQRLAWKYAWWRCSRIANRSVSLRLRSA